MINELILNGLKKKYLPGTKVKLLCMDDPQAPPFGTKGIVRCVDAIGTIHVDWENGSTLGVAFGKDKCIRI